MPKKRWLTVVIPVAVALPIAASVSQGTESATRVFDIPARAVPQGSSRTVIERSAVDASASPVDAPVRAELRRSGADRYVVLIGPSDALEGFVGDQAPGAPGAAAPTETDAGSFAAWLPLTGDGTTRVVVVAPDRAAAGRAQQDGRDGRLSSSIVASDEIAPLSGHGPSSIVSYSASSVDADDEPLVVVASFPHAPIRPEVASGLGGTLTTVAGRPAVVYARSGGAFISWSPDDGHLIVLDCASCSASSVRELAASVAAVDQ